MDRLHVACFVAFGVLWGCSGEGGASKPGETGGLGSDSQQAAGGDSVLTLGKKVYEQPLESGNSFACVTCHALSEPSGDGLRRPGHPIGDAPRRRHFKNGKLDTFLAATNSCLDEWMAVAEPWDEESPEFVALTAFLEHEGDDLPVQDVTIQRIDPPQDVSAFQGADPMTGRDVFNRTCSVCHGQDGTGTNRAPRIVGYDTELMTIAERVRRSGAIESTVYDGLTGGRMPFWGENRLSDAELFDIAAYVRASNSNGGLGMEDDSNPMSDITPSDPPEVGNISSCSKTHPKVGQQAVLTEEFHDVAGTVTVVDDCTLEFDMFSYDAQGIVVNIYGGKGGNYDDGFAIGPNLIRSVPYDNVSFQLNLPEGKTLDDLDGVSVWCVDVAVSFGDGLFE